MKNLDDIIVMSGSSNAIDKLISGEKVSLRVTYTDTIVPCNYISDNPSVTYAGDKVSFMFPIFDNAGNAVLYLNGIDLADKFINDKEYIKTFIESTVNSLSDEEIKKKCKSTKWEPEVGKYETIELNIKK